MKSLAIFDFRFPIALAAALISGVAAWAATNDSATNVVAAGPTRAGQSIGIEGRVVVELPALSYQVKPLDDRTELILRVEKVEPGADGRGRYHFHFIGLEPGGYALADYLVRPDGTRPDELAGIRLQVQAMLPADHDGQLNAHVPRAFPFIGGYRAALVVAGLLWVGGLVAFAVAGRRKRRPTPVIAAQAEPSIAERLQPLVEAAATGQLSIEGQAALERLLMGYWRERLGWPDLRVAEALARLKVHAEAGAILRAVERWLHQPGATGASEIRTLLQPYRKGLAGGPLAARAGSMGERRTT